MEKLLAGIIGAGVVSVLFGLLLCISPAILLWSVNTLAAAAGLKFYIFHTLWNYWAALWLIIILRGGK